MHEFMAAGRAALEKLVQKLVQKFPGWLLVAIEQPRLEKASRELISPARWLYAESNILIHLLTSCSSNCSSSYHKLCSVERYIFDQLFTWCFKTDSFGLDLNF